ncbi:MAG TPA: FAD-binding protein, partial [Adhaeribacter sp.]|nr:FAD-binding protein [Adhaeribacter sp.]
AAHYLCGGIVTDTYGQTTLEGLYACGESACTGLHGANRLASNSLPEAWLFAGRAAEHALLHHLQDLPPAIKPWSAKPSQTLTAPPAGIINRRKTNLRNLMWQHAGIVRTTQGLLNCRQKLEEMHHETQTLLPQFPASVALLELRNLVQVALLIVEAALNRSESVGCHYITSTFSPGKNQSKSGFAVLK